MPAAAEYTELMATRNDMRGIQTRIIPQMRQMGLLALMRNALKAGGESHRLIVSCQHAGGKIAIGGVEHDQALLILNRRWSDGGLDDDAGAGAKHLYQMRWPTVHRVVCGFVQCTFQHCGFHGGKDGAGATGG